MTPPEATAHLIGRGISVQLTKRSDWVATATLAIFELLIHNTDHAHMVTGTTDEVGWELACKKCGYRGAPAAAYDHVCPKPPERDLRQTDLIEFIARSDNG